MSELYIEVPVTRRARVTLIGAVGGRPCDFVLARAPYSLGPRADFQVAVRAPFDTAGFRSGLGRCVGGRLILDGIPAACVGDFVYRVEPAE